MAAKAHGDARGVQELIESIQRLAANRNIERPHFSPSEVRAVFAPLGTRTKHEIAAFYR